MELSRIWYDPAIVPLSQSAKLTLIALLTSPKANKWGVYQVRPEVMAAETGFNPDDFVKGFAELKKQKMVTYDENTFTVAVLCWFKYTTICNPKHAIGVLRKLKNAIKCESTKAFYDSTEKLVIEKYGMAVIHSAFAKFKHVKQQSNQSLNQSLNQPINTQAKNEASEQNAIQQEIDAVTQAQIKKLSELEIQLKNGNKTKFSEDYIKQQYQLAKRKYPEIYPLEEVEKLINWLNKSANQVNSLGIAQSKIERFFSNAQQKAQGKNPFEHYVTPLHTSQNKQVVGAGLTEH